MRSDYIYYPSDSKVACFFRPPKGFARWSCSTLCEWNWQLQWINKLYWEVSLEHWHYFHCLWKINKRLNLKTNGMIKFVIFFIHPNLFKVICGFDMDMVLMSSELNTSNFTKHMFLDLFFYLFFNDNILILIFQTIVPQYIKLKIKVTVATNQWSVFNDYENRII